MKPRRSRDAYMSAEWQVDQLLDRIPVSGMVLEPCVGTGVIAGALEDRGLVVFTNDIDPTVKARRHSDAVASELWQDYQGIDWVVTNPPFGQALAILDLAFKAARVGVAFQLRISFAEPTTKGGPKGPPRHPWLKAHEDKLRSVIFLPRYSFTQDGHTDSVTTAWFIWTHKPINVPPFAFAGPAEDSEPDLLLERHSQQDASAGVVVLCPFGAGESPVYSKKADVPGWWPCTCGAMHHVTDCEVRERPVDGEKVTA